MAKLWQVSQGREGETLLTGQVAECSSLPCRPGGTLGQASLASDRVKADSFINSATLLTLRWGLIAWDQTHDSRI